MTEQEINEIIARFEFEDKELFIDSTCVATVLHNRPLSVKKTYTISLDSLIPVWRKIGEVARGRKAERIELIMQPSQPAMDGTHKIVFMQGFPSVEGRSSDSIFHAAAHATALAIQEINQSVNED